MPHLSVTVYLWSSKAQDRFLIDCMAPAIRELRSEGQVRRFWFERMDIRGPHVFAPIMVAEDAVPEVTQRLSARIEGYLSTSPCEAILSMEEIRQRHRFCRGKLQSATDRLPGFAENNTFSLVDHGERDFPFHLSAGLEEEEEELWYLLTELTLWAIEELSGPTPAARWFASLDYTVKHHTVLAERFWRYHASTLLLTLEESLAREEEQVLSRLPSAIGARNWKTFQHIWTEVAKEGRTFPWIGRIVPMVLAAVEIPEAQRFALLREIIHCGLKQLRLPVSLHLPLALYAWNRNLAGAAAPASVE